MVAIHRALSLQPPYHIRYDGSVTREERTYLKLAIDQETRRRNLPELRRQVERGFERRNTRPRRAMPAKYARAA